MRDKVEGFTLDSIKMEVAEILNLSASDIPMDADLIDFGLDSIRVMTLLNRWKELGLRIDFVDLVESTTLFGWLELILESQNKD